MQVLDAFVRSGSSLDSHRTHAIYSISMMSGASDGASEHVGGNRWTHRTHPVHGTRASDATLTACEVGPLEINGRRSKWRHAASIGASDTQHRCARCTRRV